MPSQAFERGRGQPQPQATFAKARAQRTAETRNAEPRAHDYEGGEPGVPRAAAGSSSLLSSQTNASVAASFEALNQMLSSQNQETMESLTRELMQPLLKQWLDDNLPTLVEKLVRAEIERVARGGRG
jgi:cell pole-organizing protein PopZ